MPLLSKEDLMPSEDIFNFIPIGTRYPRLEVLFVGYQKCKSGHSFGPHIRDYELIHYVKSGEGTLYNASGEYRVRAGEIFIIHEGELTTYTADRENPWEYIWVALRGIDDPSFLTLPSVIPYPSTTFLSIEEGATQHRNYSFFISRAYSLLSHLLEGEHTPPTPEALLHEHIELQYMHPFSMEELSRRFGFERSYLGRLFKKRYGLSPREHLLAVRMMHAKDFLSRGYSVGECALMCGYTDSFQFSKAFRAFVRQTPSAYRQKVAK